MRDKGDWIDVVLAIAVAALLLGLMVGYAQCVYHDWTCAFAECRKFK